MTARKIVVWGCTLLLPALLVVLVLLRRWPSGPKTIAVVPETTAQEIWESEHAGAAHAARSFGWQVYWNGPSREDDFPLQAQIVRRTIARKVAGLVLSPDHDVVLISAVQEALDRGIPTVIVGSPLGISPGKDLTFVINDDAAMGRLGAERAARYLKPGDSAVILGVNPNLLSSIERAEAFEQAAAKLVPGIRFQEKLSTSVSSAEAEETAEEVVRGDPRLRVIFALNVSQSRAAYAALFNMRKAGTISLIACDQDLDLLYHLRTGAIDSLIAQNTYAMGYEAVEVIHQELAGRHVEPKTIVPPVLITRENVDSDAVQNVLNMNWRATE